MKLLLLALLNQGTAGCDPHSQELKYSSDCKQRCLPRVSDIIFMGHTLLARDLVMTVRSLDIMQKKLIISIKFKITGFLIQAFSKQIGLELRSI